MTTTEDQNKELFAGITPASDVEKKTQGRAQTIRLTEEIFSRAVLLSVTMSSWTGKSRQDEDDIRSQGLQAEIEDSKGVFIPGHKYLIDPSRLKPFGWFRSRIDYILKQYSYPFPISGVRFIPKAHISTVLDQLDDLEKDFNAAVEVFCSNIDLYKTEMEQKFPALWPNISKAFPSDESIREKFGVSRCVFTWNQTQIDEISKRESERFLHATRSFMDEASDHFRQATIKAATSFKKALETDGKVNNRSIKAFKEFIDRFNGLNFFNDKEMENVIEKMKVFMEEEDKWVDKGEDKTVQEMRKNISKHIEEIVVCAEDKAARLAVVSNYERSIELEEVPEIQVTSSDENMEVKRGVGEI